LNGRYTKAVASNPVCMQMQGSIQIALIKN